MPDNIIFYEGDDKNLRIKTLVEDDNLWLTQAQLADLYHTSKQNISQHLKKCFAEQELDQNSVVKSFFTTAADGKKYDTMSYNQAIHKADAEYDKYRKKELANYESDFDRSVKELENKVKQLAHGDTK